MVFEFLLYLILILYASEAKKKKKSCSLLWLIVPLFFRMRKVKCFAVPLFSRMRKVKWLFMKSADESPREARSRR